VETKTIRQEIFIEAQPEEVYEAFMDPKKFSDFTDMPATMNRKKDGKFTARGGNIFGRNLEIEKGEKIVQEWQTTKWPAGAEPSLLDLAFKHTKGGTLVILRHSNVPASQFAVYADGWEEYYWKPLKNYFMRIKNGK
jgi:activator of HSP90 ATPase